MIILIILTITHFLKYILWLLIKYDLGFERITILLQFPGLLGHVSHFYLYLLPIRLIILSSPFILFSLYTYSFSPSQRKIITGVSEHCVCPCPFHVLANFYQFISFFLSEHIDFRQTVNRILALFYSYIHFPTRLFR